MSQAYIALGTNLGNRTENLNRAAFAVAALPLTKVTAVSRIYETEPVDCPPCDNFYNAVIRVETELSPKALLGACLGIEAGMGRIRTKKNGPRVIDLDLLLYEGYEEATPELTVPHPRMGDRAFVLMPLSDLMKTPPLKKRLKELGDNGVKLTTEQLICP